MNISEQGLDDESAIILPWWQNPLNFLALGLAMLIFGAGIGYYFGDSAATPSANKVDIGFLQDMRYHHDQAVEMAYYYRTSVDDPQPRLLMFSEEILLGQQLESGRMVQMLRTFGAAEANDTGVAMSWMGHAVPIDDMDGLASQEELDSLARATGVEASKIFARLMIIHHQGGVAMAKYAILHGSNDDVISFAASIVEGQSAELIALEEVLDGLN